MHIHLLLALNKANMTYLRHYLKVASCGRLALHPSPNLKAGGSKMQDSNLHLLTVSEMAKILRIGRSSAYELCKQKEFPVIRIGKNIRIPQRALLDWVERQSAM
jgi:excisionase family DNA binding protein